jgi:hypothetical protein
VQKQWGVAFPNKGNCLFPKAGVCPFYVAAVFQDNIPAFFVTAESRKVDESNNPSKASHATL